MSSLQRPSPTRSQPSQGSAQSPQPQKPRRSRSVASPSNAFASGRLSSMIQEYRERNMGSFVLSPLVRRSILTDNTDIEEPRRKSWWKKLDENSRDVMEILEDNKVVEPNNIIEELDIEILSQEKKNYTLDLPESSDSESINSIVIPQRKFFTEKENQPQKKFGQFGTRDMLGKFHKTNSGENAVSAAAKELFQNKPRSKPIFPAALLNISPNKTSGDKTLTAVEPKGQVRNIFGNRQGTKRKNMFANFIVSESEDEIPEIQPKVFGFQKRSDMVRRPSSSRGLRDSPTSSVTTDMELDDWKLLPSSTMVENQLEAMISGGHTPKRARLSKLSEAKESDAATNSTETTKQSNNDTEKLKHSNKSASKNKSKTIPTTKSPEQNISISTRNKSNVSLDKDEQINKSQGRQDNNISQLSIVTRSKNKSSVVSGDSKPNASINKSRNNSSKVKNASKISSKLTGHEPVPQDDDDEFNFSLKYADDENADEVDIPKGASQQNASLTNTSNKLGNNSKNMSRKEISSKNKTLQKTLANKIVEESIETDSLTLDNENTSILIKEKPNNLDHEHASNEAITNNEDIADQQELSIIKESIEENKSVKEQENEMDIDEIAEKDVESKGHEIENEIQISEDENTENESAKVINQAEDDEEKQKSEELHSQTEELEDESQNKENHEKTLESENKIREDENYEINLDEEQNEVREAENESDQVEQEENQENQNKSQEQSNLIEEENQEEQTEEEIQNISQVIQNTSDEVQNETEEPDNQSEVENQSEIENESEVEKESEVENESDAENKSEVENESEAENESDAENESEVENESVAENDELENMSETENEEDKNNDSQELKNDSEHEQQDNSHEGIIQNYSEEEVDDQQEIENDDGHETSEEASESDQDDRQENVSVQETDSDQNDNQQDCEEIATETPNVSHDTTGRNRKKSPEVILHDTKNDVNSFAIHDRNTSVRKTKSMIKNLNIRPSLEPVRESISFSEGTKNSSTEGSGWDSHRTTRKTLRQTFGKDLTPRQSLRTLVMEKSVKRQTVANDLTSVTAKFPQANSTELPEVSTHYDDEIEMDHDIPESDHEVSRRTRQTTLEMYMQNIKKQNMENNAKMDEEVRNSLKVPSRDILNPFKVPAKPMFPQRGINKTTKPKAKTTKSFRPLEVLPEEIIEDLKYKPPKRFRPSNAPWITKKLYKYLETKLEPKYDYKARVRSEKLAETLYHFVKDLRRRDIASTDAVDVLKREMARLDVVKTHFEFYQFFFKYMPREVRIKVIPDVVNKIPVPRQGVFADIL